MLALQYRKELSNVLFLDSHIQLFIICVYPCLLFPWNPIGPYVGPKNSHRSLLAELTAMHEYIGQNGLISRAVILRGDSQFCLLRLHYRTAVALIIQVMLHHSIVL